MGEILRIKKICQNCSTFKGVKISLATNKMVVQIVFIDYLILSSKGWEKKVTIWECYKPDFIGPKGDGKLFTLY